MNPRTLAIQKTTGPCVILAGAGTGKTHAIVEKIKYLINQKIHSPEKIVCLTFSNEAANSLASRILKQIKTEKQPIIRTFHSFCADILKKHGTKIGIPENFKILLPDDAKIILYKNFKIQPSFCHKYVNEIGIAKDLGISVEKAEIYLAQKNISSKEQIEKEINELSFHLQTAELKKEEKTLLKEKINNLSKLFQTKKFIDAWKAYEKFKTVKNFQDYSDLNKNALILLKKHPEISKEYSYIIVDEFQDTNKLQCDFLEKIAWGKNITIVGDLNQSIFRFRGAYKNNLEQFKKFLGVR
jgi:DNA helicase-2/ATP-dependent DNA helicase PcrA